MKNLLLGLCGLLGVSMTAHAQWYSKTYSLATGWNGIWLSGDATYTTVGNLFDASTQVQEVWRWSPNPDQTGFTGSPSTPSTTSEEWKVWKRTDPSEQNLTKMLGNSSYLIRCSAPTSVTIKQLAMPPSATWLVSGANFIGLPGYGPGDTTSPLLSTYLASFPSALTTVLAPGAKVYKYVGGDLGASNPLQIQPGAERLNSSRAYWFEASVASDFTAPLEYEMPTSQGLAFGRTLTAMTMGVTNRLTTDVTLTVRLESSEAAPAGQPGVTGGVGLTRRVFNSTTGSYDETPVEATGFTVTVAGSGRANLDFGVDRSAVVESDAFRASVLRITDSAGLTDVRLPVSALASNPGGLWIARAEVTGVGSTVPGVTGTRTSQPFPLVFLIHVDSQGVARMLSQVFIGKLATADQPLGLCVSEAKVLTKAQSGLKPYRYVSCQLPGVSFINGSGALTPGSTMTWNITVPHNDPTNPFLHTYHPDHDSLDASFSAVLPSGNESYTVGRTCGFTFTAQPPNGSSVQGWGTTVLGGTYAETLRGLNGQRDLNVSGTFAMRRISELTNIDLTAPTP
jgi:hypothetical protein